MKFLFNNEVGNLFYDYDLSSYFGLAVADLEICQGAPQDLRNLRPRTVAVGGMVALAPPQIRYWLVLVFISYSLECCIDIRQLCG